MKHIFLLLSLTLSLTLTKAQTNPQLKALVLQAIGQSPRVRVSSIVEQGTLLRVQDARAAYLPQVTASVNYTYLNPVGKVNFPSFITDQGSGFLKLGGFLPLQFVPNHNFNAQVGLSQTLLDFGRTRTAISVSEQQAVAQRNLTASARHALAYQVAEAYYGMVFTSQSIAVQDSVLRSLAESRRIIESKVRNGDAIDLDVLNTITQIDQAQNRRIDLVAQLEKQRNNLAYLLGQPAPAITTNTFDFALPQQAASLNPDVQLAEDRIANADLQTKAVDRNLYPTLTANVTGGAKNGYQPDIAEILPNIAAGVTLAAPIYSGGRLKRAQQLALTQVEAAKVQLEDTKQSIARDLANAEADRKFALDRLENTRSQLTQAERAFTISKSRYANGVATNLDVLTANNGLQLARLAEIQYQYQKTLAELEIAQLKGVAFWQ